MVSRLSSNLFLSFVLSFFFGQVELWSGQAQYILHLPEERSDLKRKFLALKIDKNFCVTWILIFQTLIIGAKIVRREETLRYKLMPQHYVTVQYKVTYKYVKS